VPVGGIALLLSNRDPIGPDREGWEQDDSVEEELRRQWIQDGLVVVKNVLSPEQISSYNEVVEGARLLLDDQKDQFGFGDRVGQLHQRFPQLIEAAAQRPITEFLTWAFGEKPVLFGSLNFDRGTTQQAHIDAIFFYPEPSYAMAGVWIAMEDVHVDAGPLFYLRGSHRWHFNRGEDLVSSRPELALRRAAAARGTTTAQERGEVVRDLGTAWTNDLLAHEAEQGATRETVLLTAGDAVIWHSLLAHGGSPRLNPAMGRKSIVFHYWGATAKLYTFDQFMLFDRGELASQTSTVVERADYKGLQYMKFPNVTTYVDGQERLHEV
jgi:ectoine hydroxylase-related dioxygenase (phytanoyl-CoA dioxygenase family)